MTSTLGMTLVLGALLAAAFGAVVGIEGGLRHRAGALKIVLGAVTAFLLCMLGANLTMVYALVTHDFSVHYVAQVGSRATPLVYTVVSLWSALEGSILFWGAILAVYVFAFARAHRHDPPTNPLLALGTMLAVGVFFAFLIAGPANPSSRVTPVPPDGPGPNPLLQNHVLMVIHPPMLYLGYVGMVVPFGIAVAALLRGQLGDAWMAVLRRWTLIPWTFLSVGIVLGAWWAYAVLGWGGYWAWDPVENASFLPWLTATAFIHSAMVQERRHTLKLWTLSLSLASFLLTILGTFMTRSRVFNSVHSFTQSEIGPTFLVFLGAVLIVSIVLIAVRGPLLVPEGTLGGVASRETAILFNNLLFAALTFTVLLGTVFPLVREAFSGVRISVGGPYFNRMAIPLGIAILFLMGVGPSLPWGRASPETVKRQFLLPAGVGIAVVVVCLAAGLRGGSTLLTFGLAGFVAAVTLREMTLPVRVRMREQAEPLPGPLADRHPGPAPLRRLRGAPRGGAGLPGRCRFPVLRVAHHRDPEARRAVPARTLHGADVRAPQRRGSASALDRGRGPGDRRQRSAARPCAADELLRAEHQSRREPCHPLGRVRGPLPDAPGLRSGRPVRQLQRLDLPDGLVDLVEPALLRVRRAVRRVAGAPARAADAAERVPVPSKARSPGAAA